jgi:hypothetical protein
MKFNLIVLIVVVGLIFRGCSALPENVAGNFKVAINAFNALVFGYEDFPLSRELIEQIPYASITMKIGKGPAGLLILESINNEDEYTWASADGIFITTKGGRIIAAQGLPNNLTYFNSSEPTFLEVIADKTAQNYYRYISLDNPSVYEMRVEVNYMVVGATKIDIFDQEIEVIEIQEDINNAYIRWRYSNRYWVDPKTGFVWESDQMIAPNIPNISIQVTKKPSV